MLSRAISFRKYKRNAAWDNLYIEGVRQKLSIHACEPHGPGIGILVGHTDLLDSCKRAVMDLAPGVLVWKPSVLMPPPRPKYHPALRSPALNSSLFSAPGQGVPDRVSPWICFLDVKVLTV